MNPPKAFPINDLSFLLILIPQCPPFVMVDSLLSYHEKGVVGALTVTADNIFVDIETQSFQASGFIEHMAQAVALYTGYQCYLKDEGNPIGYIGALKNIEIKRLPKVGEQILTTVEILQDFMGVTLVSVRSEVGGEEIAKGELKTVVPQENV